MVRSNHVVPMSYIAISWDKDMGQAASAAMAVPMSHCPIVLTSRCVTSCVCVRDACARDAHAHTRTRAHSGVSFFSLGHWDNRTRTKLVVSKEVEPCQ